MEQFKYSDHHTGYFCYNSIYFIAHHGICALWEPNENEIHSTTNSDMQGKSDESTTNVSASFSCEMCDQKFSSRQELKQHSMRKHK